MRRGQCAIADTLEAEEVPFVRVAPLGDSRYAAHREDLLRGYAYQRRLAWLLEPNRVNEIIVPICAAWLVGREDRWEEDEVRVFSADDSVGAGVECVLTRVSNRRVVLLSGHRYPRGSLNQIVRDAARGFLRRERIPFHEVRGSRARSNLRPDDLRRAWAQKDIGIV